VVICGYAVAVEKENQKNLTSFSPPNETHSLCIATVFCAGIEMLSGLTLNLLGRKVDYRYMMG
jgi:hypothetical protein